MRRELNFVNSYHLLHPRHLFTDLEIYQRENRKRGILTYIFKESTSARLSRKNQDRRTSGPYNVQQAYRSGSQWLTKASHCRNLQLQPNRAAGCATHNCGLCEASLVNEESFLKQSALYIPRIICPLACAWATIWSPPANVKTPLVGSVASYTVQSTYRPKVTEGKIYIPISCYWPSQRACQ